MRREEGGQRVEECGGKSREERGKGRVEGRVGTDNGGGKRREETRGNGRRIEDRRVRREEKIGKG